MSKASEFWEALLSVQHLEEKKVTVLNSCSDVVCFINPSCPDSRNLAEKITKFCIHHNKMSQFKLNLHLIDVDGLFGDSQEGQLLLFNGNGFTKDTDNDLNDLIFPMWKKYGNKYVDAAFSKSGEAYYIPQIVLWHNAENKIQGAWYQHHHFDSSNGHALSFTCTDPECKYCIQNY